MTRAFAVLIVVAITLTARAADPPAPVKPTHLSALNTDKDEDDPFLSNSGLQLYFASNARDGRYMIWVATRRKIGQPWSEGKLVDGYFPDKPADNRSPFVMPEGRSREYLFVAARDPKAKNYDIFGLTREERDQAFAARRGINPLGTPDDELHPWLTADGKQLYFSRKTKDGWRVYVATRKSAAGVQGWDDPVPVDLPVGFHHATLDRTGMAMYLQGPLDKDRWGLFRATRTEKGWSKPEPLDELNDPKAPTGDRSPSLNREGTLLYFASDRTGGKGGVDIWAVQTALLGKN
jgi:hypothetical protein